MSKINEKADSALLAFLNIIKKLNKSKEILIYRKDPLLIEKFGKNFSVQMGFGLHTGWGIEGAIGSLYKIDCSYLSPNVNSLVKTMSFPILLDVVHLSKIPWTIWYSTIWFFAAIVVYILSKKLFKNKYLPLFFYTYVLFFYSGKKMHFF